MTEIKRSLNANKLFNRVLECENDMKNLFKFGFKLINLTDDGLSKYFAIRSKLRCTLERLILEEPAFSSSNSFYLKLWEDCYAKPVGWIEEHFDKIISQGSSCNSNTLQLRRLRSLLISILDEGSTLFQLLLRSSSTCPIFKYNFSIYASILLRKREGLLSFNSKESSRSFNLLQDSIIFEPQNGFGYFILAQWFKSEGDFLLSMYWALISTSTPLPYDSLDFLKDLSRDLATSPSFLPKSKSTDLIQDLLQIASHALISQLTGKSHLKHLDQLSHSQITSTTSSLDVKSLKYACIIIWMILGLENRNDTSRCKPSDDTIYNSKDNTGSSTAIHSCAAVTQVQSCLLAKLFQIHNHFWSVESIRRIFLAFASNPAYSNLFTFSNYKSLEKLNNLTFSRLNELLKTILKTNSNEEIGLDDCIYIDFSMLKSFVDYTQEETIVEYFISKQLYTATEDECDDSVQSTQSVQLTFTLEKTKKTERSMKLLTHRFLQTKLETIESTLNPSNIPWTIPDYQCLLQNFSKIRKSILARDMKIIITGAVLEELDLEKGRSGKSREIIRFLLERLNLNDSSIKILENGNKNHFVCLKELSKDFEDCRIVIMDPELFIELEKRIPAKNLFKVL